MSRRRHQLLGAMMLLSLGTAACGGSTDSTASSPSESSPAETEPDDTPTTPPAEAGVDADAAADADVAADADAADLTTEPVGDANTRLVGEFETLDGSTINLAEFHSEDLVLWMWAPW